MVGLGLEHRVDRFRLGGGHGGHYIVEPYKALGLDECLDAHRRSHFAAFDDRLRRARGSRRRSAAPRLDAVRCSRYERGGREGQVPVLVEVNGRRAARGHFGVQGVELRWSWCHTLPHFDHGAAQHARRISLQFDAELVVVQHHHRLDYHL